MGEAGTREMRKERCVAREDKVEGRRDSTVSQ